MNNFDYNSNKKINNTPTGSDESTIIASYFPSGEFLRNLIAVTIMKNKMRKSAII